MRGRGSGAEGVATSFRNAATAFSAAVSHGTDEFLRRPRSSCWGGEFMTEGDASEWMLIKRGVASEEEPWEEEGVQ